MHLLKIQSTLPWMCGKDLIEILFSHKKREGNPIIFKDMQAFYNNLEDYDLRDLGFLGYKYT